MASSGRLREAWYRATYRFTLARVPNRAEIPHLLNRRGLVGRGAEIGVAKGNFSDLLLRGWRGSELVSVDPWFGEDEVYEACRERLAVHGSRSTVWRMTSEEAAKYVAPGSLDFVYVDADHGLEETRSDLRHWYDKVCEGGLFAGHDYFDSSTRRGGCRVKTAVDEFAAQRGLTVHATFAEPVKVTDAKRRQKAISWLILAAPEAQGPSGALHRRRRPRRTSRITGSGAGVRSGT